MTDPQGERKSNPDLEQGIAVARAGRKHEAIPLLHKGLHLDGRNLKGWVWLARAYDEPEIKRKCYQVVLKLDPGNREALVMLAGKVGEGSPSEPENENTGIRPLSVGLEENWKRPIEGSRANQTPNPSKPGQLMENDLHHKVVKAFGKTLGNGLLGLLGVGAAMALCLTGLLVNSVAGYVGGESRATRPTTLPATALQTSLASVAEETSTYSVEYILDASGSMNETLLDGTRKADAARQLLSDSLKTYRPETGLGLRVYGHRLPETPREPSCQDIELIAPLEPGYQGQMATWLQNGYQPQGMTPIATALQQAVTDFSVEPGRVNSIVLISDGQETCGGDPCQVVRDLETAGIRFSLHVIGLNVDDSTRAQLTCIAQAGGGVYQDANTSQELQTALEVVQQQVVQEDQAILVAPPAETPAVPDPTSMPVLLTDTPTIPVPTSTPALLTHTTRNISETGTCYKVNIDYPYFEGSEDLASGLNQAVDSLFRPDLNDYPNRPCEDFPEPNYVRSENEYKITYQDGRVISIWFPIHTYGQAAAHANQNIHTLNYDLINNRPLSMVDFFLSNSNFPSVLASYCNNNNYPAPSPWSENDFQEYVLGTEINLSFVTEPLFNLQQDGFLFSANQYAVTCVGCATCVAPYRQIEAILNPTAPLPAWGRLP